MRKLPDQPLEGHGAVVSDGPLVLGGEEHAESGADEGEETRS